MITVDEIREVMLDTKADFAAGDQEELIKSGILDSMEVMLFAVALGEEFDITISPLELKEENFSSLEVICEFVNRLVEEQ